MDKLKAKRFRQIFDYLDADGAGHLDLTALVNCRSDKLYCTGVQRSSDNLAPTALELAVLVVESP